MLITLSPQVATDFSRQVRSPCYTLPSLWALFTIVMFHRCVSLWLMSVSCCNMQAPWRQESLFHPFIPSTCQNARCLHPPVCYPLALFRAPEESCVRESLLLSIYLAQLICTSDYMHIYTHIYVHKCIAIQLDPIQPFFFFPQPLRASLGSSDHTILFFLVVDHSVIPWAL